MDEARLKQSPLFAGLNRKERQALAPRTDEIDLEQGRVIVREGEWPYEFFAIEQGTVEVRRGEQLLAELGPGDFFGEMGLVSDTRRNASRGGELAGHRDRHDRAGLPCRPPARCPRWRPRSAPRSRSAAGSSSPSTSASRGSR